METSISGRVGGIRATVRSRSAFASIPTRAGRFPAAVSVFERSKLQKSSLLVRGLAEDEDEELQAAADEFMKKQALLEIGAEDVPKAESVIGGDVVSDAEAQQYCSEIMAVFDKLKESRDMSFAEAKLTVAIEDPRARDRRDMGIESETGVSRDEMAAILEEIYAGKVPNDRIALKVTWEEMMEWPSLEVKPSTPTPEPSSGTGGWSEAAAGWREGQARPPIGRDKEEKPQSIEDMLPDWIGYSGLYLVSAVPVFIGLFVVVVLFINSLR